MVAPEHSGGGSRRMSEFEAISVYRVKASLKPVTKPSEMDSFNNC